MVLQISRYCVKWPVRGQDFDFAVLVLWVGRDAKALQIQPINTYPNIPVHAELQKGEDNYSHSMHATCLPAM